MRAANQPVEIHPSRLSSTAVGTTTHYAYDGDDLYARFTSGWSAPSSMTVHGGGVDEPLWELTGATSGPSANARYYHADGLGSVVALSAVSSGALTSERRYDAFDNRQQRITTVTEFAIHDAANRLVEIRSGSAAGPLLTVAHHDVDGQLLRLCDIRTGGTLSGSGASCTATGAGARQLALTWDASGRLSQAVVNGPTYSYTCDHADRRLSINPALALRPDVRPAHCRRATPCRIAVRCPA